MSRASLRGTASSTAIAEVVRYDRAAVQLYVVQKGEDVPRLLSFHYKFRPHAEYLDLEIGDEIKVYFTNLYDEVVDIEVLSLNLRAMARRLDLIERAFKNIRALAPQDGDDLYSAAASEQVRIEDYLRSVRVSRISRWAREGHFGLRAQRLQRIYDETERQQKREESSALEEVARLRAEAQASVRQDLPYLGD